MLWTFSKAAKDEPFAIGIRARQQVGIDPRVWSRLLEGLISAGYVEVVEHRPGKPSLLLFHEKPNKG